MIPTGMPRKDTKPPYWGWSFKGSEVQKLGLYSIALVGSPLVFDSLYKGRGMDWGYANTEPRGWPKEGRVVRRSHGTTLLV